MHSTTQPVRYGTATKTPADIWKETADNLEKGQKHDMADAATNNHFAQEYLSNAILYGKPENTYQGKLLALAETARTAEAPAAREAALEELKHELRDIRAFLDETTRNGTRSNGIMAAPLIGTIDGLPESVTDQNAGEWTLSLKSICNNLNSILYNEFQEANMYLPNADEAGPPVFDPLTEVPYCPKFKDATAGFSEAISRGGRP